jgi:hypothetical protein
MLRKIHETNLKFLDRPNIKCENGPVLPPTQVFYFNDQALQFNIRDNALEIKAIQSPKCIV